jgi:hypothetical protein
MKRDKIFYWIATSIVALLGLMASIMYFASPFLVKEFNHLGFPDYFGVELSAANMLGSLAILLPMISGRIKEWAYAGLAIEFISATIAHIAVEDISKAISLLVSLLFLIISYIYYVKINSNKVAVGD